MAKSSRKKPVRKASGTSSRKKGATKKSSSVKKSSAKKKTSSKKTTTKKKTQRTAKPAGGAKKKAATGSTAKSTRGSTKKAAASTGKSQETTGATAPKAASTPADKTSATTSGKKGPKGITVVTPKPTRKEPSRGIKMPETEPLLKPGGKWKPLIPSGPSAAPAAGLDGDDNGGRKKQRLNKRELDKYRKILLAKREELLGDITNMEDEALRGSGSGSLSHTPQHMAEQGSDAYDQALSLDLAQVDRNLLKEIDEALKRIDDGTYGFCELTGRRIRNERLEELPWTRYSIEAARERERRSFR